MTATGPITHLWIDTETTGLDLVDDALLEVAIVATDTDLNEVFATESLIRPTATAFARLLSNPVVSQMHATSGLIAELRRSSPAKLPTAADFEARVLELLDLSECAPEIRLAGGGVAAFDQPLVKLRMPRLTARLHYRPLDTSVVMQAYLDATGHELYRKTDAKRHRAMADIREDIEVAKTIWGMFRAIEEARSSEERTSPRM